MKQSKNDDISFFTQWKFRRDYFRDVKRFHKYEDQINANECRKCKHHLDHLKTTHIELWACPICDWQMGKFI